MGASRANAARVAFRPLFSFVHGASAGSSGAAASAVKSTARLRIVRRPDALLLIVPQLGATLGAIGALPSLRGSYPWWSLAIFLLCSYVIHGIFVYGDERVARGT
jgi:acetyl esterase/lipase